MLIAYCLLLIYCTLVEKTNPELLGIKTEIDAYMQKYDIKAIPDVGFLSGLYRLILHKACN